MSFDTIYKWAKMLAVLSVVPVMIVTAMTIWQLKDTTNHLLWATNTTMTTLPKQVDDRIGKVQTALFDKVDTVQGSLNTEVTKLATIADNRIDKLTKTTDTRLGAIEKDTVKLAGDIKEAANTQLTTANNSVTTLVTAYSKLPDVVGAQYQKDWSSYFDCAKNKLCLQGQASDTMFAWRQSSRDTSTLMTGLNVTMPKIEDHFLSISNTFATDIPLITGNINGIALNINKITTPHWYDRIIGYALNAGLIYRSINPGTVAVSAATQAVSSQK